MKKTITCATTSLLLIGILTLQTLAINFKSEENIDNLVFPFIYSDADDLVWVRKYVGDCSTCIEGRLYVKDMVTGEVKEIVSDAVKQLRESEDTLYCITNDGLSIQDNQTLLPMAIQSAIDGRLRRMEDYIARSSFTRNVEQDMTNGIIAEAFEMDREDLKRRRAQSVRNVKATNGLISLEKYARSRQEPDWDDDEWQD